ncbi:MULTISPECIES: cytochrome c oxidase subunit 3 [unclassified Rhodococcus (in: high G+C Gram-positive bacteria)]|uniref:cytochrome c oxidase subunit 3 n=1 Tax=unclassified Rhodococcus (in: high G+C Gram-positive bacteria) TaxID=192944 RepID=UPI00163B46EA|nr:MULTISPECIES: cytochrome c oxidase subunit 3 [unclassified Rhodococcus (in: high G+C Gram-positive bacteria)]MBC2637851.1 cytochrome c oxidase subunit 3 [Rhodococcus sp. 3A]MBC2897401.1 cytochrome c oxidase subunit 3 [Rhodococcus sp. 4CII]
MTVFGILFGVYAWYYGQESAQFGADQAALNKNFGFANTLLLLSSSLLVYAAVQAIRQQRHSLASPLILAAMGCGAVFLVDKGIEYYDKLSHGISAATSDFFMYYFVLTGLHAIHVIVGLALLGFVFSLSRKPTLTARQHTYLEGATVFWHMVDVLWIIMFPLLYLVH